MVEAWLELLEDQPVWPNPGRLGQYEACLAWSNDLERTRAWPAISVPCLVMAFEHDVDSPPARARQAAAPIPGARFVEIPDASHLGISPTARRWGRPWSTSSPSSDRHRHPEGSGCPGAAPYREAHRAATSEAMATFISSW